VADTGKATVSQTPINPVALTEGDNTVTVKVTAEDGTTTKTYTVKVNRAAPDPTNAQLSSIKINGASVTDFSPSSGGPYTHTVIYSTAAITVEAVAEETGATIVCAPTSPIAFTSGDSATITITVTAPNRTTTKIYTITVNRAAISSNANLNGLTVNAGTLSPAFSASSTSYTVSVPNATASITVTPTKADTQASVSQTPDNPVNLSVGANTITITVTAENGSTKTYTITVTRAEAGTEASSNANLQTLSVSPGTLSPGFSSETAAYTVTVPNTTEEISVTATVSDGNASVEQFPSANPVALNAGANVITLRVTAEAGNTKDYVIVVTRTPLSSNANLGSLSVSPGTLVPTFSPSIRDYSVLVSNATASISVTPTVEDTNASVNQTPVNVVSLNEGDNTISVTVTAEDGSTKTYTITVTRTSSDTTNAVQAVISMANEIVDLTKNTQNDLSQEANSILRVTAPDGYDSYTWKIDGYDNYSLISDREIQAYANWFNPGTHSVLLIFEKDGISYGSEVLFRVVR
jgi:hypothetical protein